MTDAMREREWMERAVCNAFALLRKEEPEIAPSRAATVIADKGLQHFFPDLSAKVAARCPYTMKGVLGIFQRYSLYTPKSETNKTPVRDEDDK